MRRAAGAAAIAVICIAVALTRPVRASAGSAARATYQAPMSTAAAEQAILAAEDARLVLPTDLHTPTIDALRARQLDDLRLLLELARSTDRSVAVRALRALGRFERRELIPELMRYLPSPAFTDEASFAIAQAFRGEPPANDSGEQIDSSLALLVQSGQIPARIEDRPGPVDAVAIAVGRLPYIRADQVRRAQAYLLSMMHAADSDPLMRPALPSVTRGMEALIRRQTRRWTPDSDTIDELRGIVINRRHEYPPQSRVNAMLALMGARGGVDAETLRVAANATTSAADNVLVQLRRLAAAVLAGSGSPVAPSERTELLTALLADRTTIVRIEAIRAWARQEVPINGCQRIYDALKDPSTPVVLAAIDALPEFCKGDVNAVDRLTIEARTPPENEWHLASHALVGLAKAAPKRVFIPLLGSHIQHQTWQVRMYAARAAAITDEVPSLERLAYDREPNVREATLGPLRRLKADEAEPYFVSALGESDYQLLRTAANELKGAKPTPQLATGLLDALLRVTAERKDTSRDTRLALLDRLRELGDPDQSGGLVPLLRDYDIDVARAAASLIQQWTGRPQEMDPQPLQRPPAAAPSEARPARVTLRSGKKFSITLRGDVAPLTVARFVQLAAAGYYNGLTFHRVVPNFVVQGGSPGANEYSGDSLYMRDEISNLSNVRGAVGLSTRGRDTGDAQFFVNLVDNPRLDFEYTVFGTAAPLDVIDEIVEGDAITSITFDKDDQEKNRADVGYAGAERWRLPTDSALSPSMRPRIVSFERAPSSRSRRRSSIFSSISPPDSPRWFRRTSSLQRCGPTSRSPTMR
jgi:cyclophilin family peptidyl-prolyl cis-trans isomerase/HEAT repeat protein